MSLKVFNVIESVDGEILNTNPFIVKHSDNEIEVKKEAEKLFIALINEHTIPVTLDEKSEKYWLDKKVYTNHNYKLQIVFGFSKN
jgi:hypothetical protein